MKHKCTLILLLSGLFLDRITKLWALYYCQTPYVITSWLSGELAYNKGIAWSIGAQSSPYFVNMVGYGIACFMVVIGYYFLWVRPVASPYALAMVMSGALSNLVDRWLYGGVLDFIVVHYHDWYWPTFNVADMLICWGALWLLWQEAV